MVSLGYDQEYLWSDPELQRLLEPNGKNTKKVRRRRENFSQRMGYGMGEMETPRPLFIGENQLLHARVI